MSTATLSHPLADGCPPDWAAEWGEDKYAPWAAFTVEGVVQRLRWIPPGRFLMGSPATEQGRYDDEGPQHTVSLTAGFWMFETPCTQALWQAVMGSNPSQFQDPERPVEQVSWHDTQEFFGRLNQSLAEEVAALPFDAEPLVLGLPTEAQWEYACRAGTTTATYAGEIEILGENNAPILDAIAWYGGNSGHEFDLPEGHDASGWPNKQYEFSKAGTRKVKRKQPNRWGLFDTLGNVGEWCLDPMRTYAPEDVVDPGADAWRGISAGERVVRGGSWYYDALIVRAAVRDAFDPGGRYYDLGFRGVQFGKS